MSTNNNRGIFNLGTAYLRQLGNDWPTAQVYYTSDITEVASNLYFTNARVVSALSTDATIVIAGNGQIRSNTSSGGITSLAGFTTANLAEGGANLYFSNTRVYQALTGGALFRPTIATFRANINQAI